MSIRRTHPNFHPGFLHLDLQSLFQKDKDAVITKSRKLEQMIGCEHEALHCALSNLVALMLAKIPHHLNEAKEWLEKLTERYPSNLNTLIHLEYIYKKLYQSYKTKVFKNLKEKIANFSQYEEEICVCLLEQGYVLFLEETVDRKDIALKKLEEVFEILNLEDVKDESSKQALNYSRDAWETLRSSLHSREEKELKDKELCVDKLRKGLSMLLKQRQTSEDEVVLVWRYHLGLANLNLEETLRTTNKIKSHFQTYLQVNTDIMSLFVEIISTVNPQYSNIVRIYKGRGIAFLVEYLIRQQKNKHLKDIEWIRRTLESTNNNEVKKILENPIDVILVAKEYAPNDTTAIIHHGRSLWLHSKSKKYKYKDLYETESLLNTIIPSVPKPDTDLIGLSTRMRTRNDLAFATRDKKERIVWLQKARVDAVECYNIGGRPEDLIYLGMICKSIAIQTMTEGIPSEESKRHFDHAIYYFNHAKVIGGFTCFKALQGLGECLYYLKKYRKALEFMKQAMLLSLEIQPKSKHTERKEDQCKTANTDCNKDNTENDTTQHKHSVVKRERHASGQRKHEKDENSAAGNVDDHTGKYTTSCLRSCCTYILQLMKQCKNKNTNASDLRNLIIELRDIIVIGKMMNAEIDVVIRHLCKMYFDEVRELLSLGLLSFQIEQHHEIAKHCLKHLLYHCKEESVRDEMEEIKHIVENTEPTQITDLEMKDHFIKTDLQFPEGPTKYLQDDTFTYDFFVSHCSIDSAWVKCFIVDRLETKIDETDVQLKGCFADRDFVPGRTICDNIINSLEKSCKIILVLTKGFINSNWCQYELEISIMKTLNGRKQNNCIIPVLKDECEIPKKISNLTYLDLTEVSTMWSDLDKLKKAIVQDVRTS